jgi:hypothetical protein
LPFLGSDAFLIDQSFPLQKGKILQLFRKYDEYDVVKPLVQHDDDATELPEPVPITHPQPPFQPKLQLAPSKRTHTF